MRKLVLGVLVLAFSGFLILPAAFADTTSLHESLVAIDTNSYHNNFALIPGINAAGFNSATGLGTLTFTISGAGAHKFDAFFDSNLNVPFYNEFGTTGGVAAAGQTWTIDDPLAGTIFADTKAHNLDSINWIPGKTDNFNGTCASVYDTTTPGCANSNDDVSMAMGFSFNLLAGQTEIITLTLSHNAPGGGFFLHQIHPIDNNTSSQLDLYFSGTAATRGGGQTPEPSSLLLALGGTPVALIFRALRQRLSRAS
jgi:hypothetical protein